ncbi:hypothetical protein HMPREF1545_01492 [Oscillibacter sp. KLE 1728]|nr:hypothetical protein HMPREF1545_01492 [Oscillibacter sp. KLE 1728]ERK61892.1 hypothetical protein HMPREF1546_02974 [Oscillibacter sp. KLE 1745]
MACLLKIADGGYFLLLRFSQFQTLDNPISRIRSAPNLAPT